jgi:hypothetical protein
MNKVFIRIVGLGRDIPVESNEKIHIDRAESIFNLFCDNNQLKGKFHKISFQFNGDVIIVCSLEREDMRDFKIKSIMI